MVGNLNDEIAGTARSNSFNKAVEEYGVTVVQQEVFEWDADKAPEHLLGGDRSTSGDQYDLHGA